MTEVTPEGHKFFIGTDKRKVFLFDSERIDEGIEYIRQHDLRIIEINSFLGYKKKDLNFLSEIADFLDGIIVPEDFADLSILNSLHKLKTLGFADNKKTVIDLSNFPDLTTLACEYSKRLVSLESCEQLRSLTLTNYKSDSANLTTLPDLTSLNSLDLFVTRIASLEGIERFPFLEELTLFRASQLENIESLREVKGTLKAIEIDTCKKIVSYEVLGELENLERLLISKSKPIASIEFVRSLPKLDFFSFMETNIEDGDLSPCVGIGYVGFDNKRHYSHKFSDFQKSRNGK